MGSKKGATKRGDEGDWIDVRPRRRKALRQDGSGQDRFKEGDRSLQGDDCAFRNDRFRVSSREDWYVGNSDLGADFYYGKPVHWGDYDSGDSEWDDDARLQPVFRNSAPRR